MGLFGKKDKKKLTKIFYTTDVHGSEVTYRKFINAAKFYDVDALVLGGDITGKFLIPIVREDGSFRATLGENRQVVSSDDELNALQARIHDQGFYWSILDPATLADMQSDSHKVERMFEDLARDRLLRWAQFAEERLKGTDVKCYITGGNDDHPEVLEVLRDFKGEHVVACEGEIVHVDDDHEMVSFGFSNPTPWNTPRELSEEELAEKIEHAVSSVSNFENCIFNFHAPPLDCTLDRCPKLDPSTDPPSPVMVAGQLVFVGVGSSSVRNAIEKYQPLLVLTGHIHESRGVAKLGRTTVVNPGSEYGEGVLRGSIISITGNEVKGFQMTSG